MFTLKENGASMPYQETMLPRNATPHIVNENSGFLCSNEFFNPNFSENAFGNRDSLQGHSNATPFYITSILCAPHTILKTLVAL